MTDVSKSLLDGDHAGLGHAGLISALVHTARGRRPFSRCRHMMPAATRFARLQP